MSSPILFESKPRWPGGPRICLAENRPAFGTEAEARAFHEANGPGSRILRLWQCATCGLWHYTYKPRPPAGDSSGSSRR